MGLYRSWISAARPRTLPLALSSIFMGSFLAYKHHIFDASVFIWAVVTTVLLQILSNFANDYGDTENGADSSDRVGPVRAVQAGSISPQTMKRAIYLTGLLSFLSGLYLLWISFGSTHLHLFLVFLGIGVLSILAAYFYTAGSKPYGYAGLGDVSVFVFFGLVGVLGVYFLYGKNLPLNIILPAASCGLLATGVLNLNNIRDLESDKRAGKMTIPARWGKPKSITYHSLLLIGAMASMGIYHYLNPSLSYWYILSFPLFILNILKLRQIPNPDPLLKQLALSTFLFVILSGISMLV